MDRLHFAAKGLLFTCLFCLITFDSLAQSQWLIGKAILLDFTSPIPVRSRLRSKKLDHLAQLSLSFDVIQSSSSGQLSLLGVSTGLPDGMRFLDADLKELPYESNTALFSVQTNPHENFIKPTLTFPNGNSYCYITYNEGSVDGKAHSALLQVSTDAEKVYLNTMLVRDDFLPSTFLKASNNSFHFLQVEEIDQDSTLKVWCNTVDHDGNIVQKAASQLPVHLRDVALIPANNSNTFLLVGHDLLTSGALSAYVCTVNDKAQASLGVHSTVYRQVNRTNDNPIFLAGSFSPNDSLIYLSYLPSRKFKRSTKASQLVRMCSQEGNIDELTPADSFKIHRMAVGPDAKLYFNQYQQALGSTSALGVLHYPDHPEKDSIALQTELLKVYGAEEHYYGGFEPNLFIGQKFLRQSASQRLCTDDFIATVNESPEDFGLFQWELLNSDSVLVASSTERAPKFRPQKSGTYHLCLSAVDPNGRKVHRWSKVSFEVPTAVSFALDQDSLCRYTELTLEPTVAHAKLRPGTSPYRWEVYRNGELIETLQSKEFRYRFDQTGEHSIQLSFQNTHCTYAYHDQPILTVLDAPNKGFSLSDSTTCTGHSVSINDHSAGSPYRVRYEWNDGKVFNGQGGHERSFSQSGTYQITQYMTATSNCATQLSKEVEIHKGLTEDSLTHLVVANVVENDKIQVEWTPVRGIKGYRIYRDEQVIDFIEDDARFSYTDALDSSIKRSYNYVVQAVDYCDHTAQKSINAGTIYLEAENEEENNLSVLLQWNAYEGWQGGASTYTLQRSGDRKNWQDLGSQEVTQYKDLNIAASERIDSLYYRVVAKDLSGKIASTSNIAAVDMRNLLFIPNAFSPNNDGINDLFKASLVGYSNFACYIYAKGQLVAYSNNPDNIWNGKSIDGSPYPIGAYTYIIHTLDQEGMARTLSGRVHIVK